MVGGFLIVNMRVCVCVCAQVQLVPTSTIRASPTDAIRPLSARRCPREATNASVQRDAKEDTARKVMRLNAVYPGVKGRPRHDHHHHCNDSCNENDVSTHTDEPKRL